MRISKKQHFVTTMVAIVVAVAGCGSGGSGSVSTAGVGRISLAISDHPMHDASKVCISFDEIQFKSQDTSITVPVTLDHPVNLLDFQGMNAYPLLTNEEIPAGRYQWMRLGVDADMGGTGGADDMLGESCNGTGSYIVWKDNGQNNLYVPSGAETGLKLVRGFTVPVNGSVDFTAEFDLMKSITTPSGLMADVILRPTIRLVDNVEAGALTGRVDNDWATADGCTPSVYVFNDGVTPNGIEDMVDDPDDPVATAMVNKETNGAGQDEYHYTVGFLVAGDYEVAFTCNGIDFEPPEGKPAEITARSVTTVNFLSE